MGLIDTSCDTVEPTVCDALFSQGVAVLSSAKNALDGIGVGCDDLESYVTMGTPVAPLVEGQDRLSVNLASYAPTPQAMAQGFAGIPELVFNSFWRLELWCHGWPIIGGDRLPRMPDPDTLNATASQMYAIGSAIYSRLLTDRSANVLFDPSLKSQIGPLLPLGPSAGLAGWGVQITVTG